MLFCPIFHIIISSITNGEIYMEHLPAKTIANFFP